MVVQPKYANISGTSPSEASVNDPWLPDGATETLGNNVDAYVDLSLPDGLSAGDFRADVTSSGMFNYTYDTSQAPDASADQRKAAIVQLFFVNNYLHDWFYDVGFDEAAGNAQDDNFGRGGFGEDSLKAEAQDNTCQSPPCLDNANMSTPADGGRPRMQMYVFTGAASNRIDVNSQPGSDIAASLFLVGVSTSFGLQIFNVTGDVVRVDDGVSSAPGGTIHDGCERPFVSSVAGKIAFIDRGGSVPGGNGCGYVLKVAELVATVATVSTTNPFITFPNGATGSFPSIAPYAMETAFVDLALSGEVNCVQDITFEVSASDPQAGRYDLLVLGGDGGNTILAGDGLGVEAGLVVQALVSSPSVRWIVLALLALGALVLPNRLRRES
jgi:hypothetical protein